MDRRHSHRASPRLSYRRTIVAAALVSLVGPALPTRFVLAAPAVYGSEYACSLAEDGGLGVLYRVGPFENGSAISPTLKPEHGSVDGEPWRLAYRPTGILDWSSARKAPIGRKQYAAVGVWLRASATFDGWLLVSADGAYRVAVDGQWIFQRRFAHPRGRGVDPIPLALPTGRHWILFGVESADNRKTFSVELRDRVAFSVPTQLRVELPQRASQVAALAELLQVKFRIDPQENDPHLHVRLSFQAGAPTGKHAVQVTLRGNGKQHVPSWDLGMWDLDQHPRKLDVDLGSFAHLNAAAATELIVRLGDARVTRPIAVSDEATMALLLASNALAALNRAAVAPDRFDVARASIQYQLKKLESALTQSDAKSFETSLRTLKELSDDILAYRPLFGKPGWHELALRSPYDLTPQSVLIQVPAAPVVGSLARFPLVVTLHGYEGTPKRILEAFLDHPGPEASVPGFVIAPEAHGNAFFRGAGESAVFDAIDWASQTFPIDANRISITGVSMGGTGAAELAFRASARFAAAAPLCGYQSFFVRRDTHGQPLRPWEQHLMHQFSPASWAESGHDVPLFVAHGTLDRPLENSKVLTERYRKLGYSLQEDWPNLGHAVWKKTYRGGSLFPWLVAKAKDQDPEHVSLTTAHLRHGRKFWLSITDFEPDTELPHVDVTVHDRTHATVRTRAVTGFCLGDTKHLASTSSIAVTIDGQRLESPAALPRCFEQNQASWATRSQARAGLRKRPYVEGPWSDLLAEPLVVVYGTQKAETAELNRYVAARLFSPKPGVTLDVPVVSDEEYARRTYPQPRAVYVGRPDDHLQYGKVSARLPIRLEQGAIIVGNRSFPEPDVGAVFVYPDPDRRERLVGFVTANGPEGLLRALALPVLVPDFMVFDRELDGAAAAIILGRSARVRAAGFFQSDWSLPPDFGAQPVAEALRFPP